MKRVGRQVGPVLALLMTMACEYVIQASREYVIVARCKGTYDWTFDYGVIVGCEVGNSGSACGYTTVRLSVEQAGVIMDQTTRSVYVCPGDKVYVEETLWGARDSLSPTRCLCQIP